jgi:hypothetical protein
MKQTKVSKFLGLPGSLYYYSTQRRRGGQDSNWEGILRGSIKLSEQNSKVSKTQIEALGKFKIKQLFPSNLSSSAPAYSLQQMSGLLYAVVTESF